MRLRTVAVIGVAATAAAVVAARRRRSAPPSPVAQVGRTDGVVHRLAVGDPAVAPLRAQAAELRGALLRDA